MDDDDFNVDLFIDEVEKRPTIWDLHSKEYSNKILKKRAWEELVLIFCGGDDSQEKKKILGSILQKKWKNLRDVYVRDMKKLKNLKSGSAAISKQQSAHFQRLTFLQTTVQKKPTESSFQVENNSTNGSLKALDDTLNSGNITSPADNLPKKYKIHPADAHFAKLLEKSIELRKPVEKKEEDDEDKLFCLSLLKEIKKVPENNRLQLKIEIYKLLAQYQTPTNIPPYPNRTSHDLLPLRNYPSTSHDPHNNNNSRSQYGYTTATYASSDTSGANLSNITSPSSIHTPSPIYIQSQLGNEDSQEFELFDD